MKTLPGNVLPSDGKKDERSTPLRLPENTPSTRTFYFIVSLNHPILMKITIRCAMLLAAFSVATLSAPLKAQDLIQKMNGFAQAWQDAYNKGDFNDLTAMYTDPVVSVNPKDGSTATVTKDQIRSDFERNFSANTPHIEIKLTDAVAQPDGRVKITGSFTGTSTDQKSGEKTAFSGTFEHLVQLDNGQWKLCQLKVTPID